VRKKAKKRVSVFEQTARNHEGIARDLESAIKEMPPHCKPSILHEVAHHVECAARMRGVMPKKPRELLRLSGTR
jgi:hypothetical protein